MPRKKKRKNMTLKLHPNQGIVFNDPSRYKVLCCSRRWGKELGVNTSILALDRTGRVFWTTMGGIAVGQFVFHPNGHPIKVIAKSEVECKRTFKMTFNDGTSIIASETHQWLAKNHLERNTKRDGSGYYEEVPIRTTLELYETQKYGRGDANYSIDNIKPLQLPKRKLDVMLPPYLLGFWLGDGCEGGSGFAVGGEDKENFLCQVGNLYEFGEVKNPTIVSLLGFVTTIRSHGLYMNKHIPKEYLFNSVEDRIALLRGLMDTNDGHIEKGGRCEFVNTNKSIIDGVVFLLRSLGITTTVRENTPFCTNGGEDTKRQKCWVVRFYSNEICPFRLPRKKEVWETSKSKKIHSVRMIVDITEVEPEATQCIQVDSEDGLWVAGEQLVMTHNSRLLMTMLITKAINFKGAFDPLSPSVCALIMPTLKQARSIHWNALVSALEGHPAVAKIHKSEFRITLKGLRPDIILRGCNEDSGDSLRGSKFYFAAFDEIQDIKETVWTEVVSPALADTAGSTALFCGCVNPNTLVLTDTGFEEIGNLDPGAKVKQWKPLNRQIWGLDKSFHNADGFWNNGLQQTLILTTEHGYTLEATYNHPVYTERGWVSLEDLEEDDKIAIDFGMEVWGETKPDESFEICHVPRELMPSKPLVFNLDMAYLMGYLAQKAHWIYENNERVGIRVTPKGKKVLEYFSNRSIGGYRWRKAERHEWGGKPFIMDSPIAIKWVEHLGIDLESPVHHRKFPGWVLKLNRDYTCQFLKGFFDANGAPLRKGGKATKRIDLHIQSKVIANQTHVLLLNLGIISKLTEHVNVNKKSNDLSVSNKKYTLAIRGEFFNTFKDNIGFRRADCADEVRNTRYSKEKRRFQVQSYYFYDSIRSIKQNACKTVDFTIPDTQSYLANGIMAHNTPKGIGTFFHQLFQREEEGLKGWKSFHQTIYDNPFIDREEIANFKAALPPKAFEQEFMASWVSFDGQIFSELTEANLVGNDAIPENFDEMILGIDWGDVNPAIVVVGYKNGIYFLVDMWENPNPKHAIEQRHHDEAAIRFCEKYNITSAYADPSRPGSIISLRKAGIPRLVKGYNRVAEGNGIMNTLLYQKRLLISKEKCQRAYEVMTAYHRKKKDGVIFDEPELHQDDHLCFAKGTKVLSVQGEKDISMVIPGDILWNGEFWDTVEITSERLAETIEVTDGKNSIRCTPDHPFETIEGEFVKADSLSYEDRIIYLGEEQWGKLLDAEEVNSPKGLSLESVRQNKQLELVYSIKMKEVSRYFVKIGDNFIKTKNCDALRYVIASREHKKFGQDNYGHRLIQAPPKDIYIPGKKGLYV